MQKIITKDFMKNRCRQTLLLQYGDDSGPLIATTNPNEIPENITPITQVH